MKATSFNQPWLANRYQPGTRLILGGRYKARNQFTVESHAPTQEGVGAEAGAMAVYPATEGLSSTQILELARRHRGEIRHVVEALPARLRALERLPDRGAALDAAHFGDAAGGRRRLAFDELLLTQLALLRRRGALAAAPAAAAGRGGGGGRGRSRRAAGRRAHADGRLDRRHAAVRPDGRS